MIKYIKGDLFNNETDNLTHSVSADFVMGKGIATKFKFLFGGVDLLKKQNKGIGDFAYLKKEDRQIYYLITKEKYWQKPKLCNLKFSLLKLRNHMDKELLFNLSMPKIGCGLDQLDWEDVEQIILEVFHEDKWKIKVYTL